MLGNIFTVYELHSGDENKDAGEGNRHFCRGYRFLIVYVFRNRILWLGTVAVRASTRATRARRQGKERRAASACRVLS